MFHSPVYFIDHTYTEAILCSHVRHVSAETLPDGRAAVTLRFADDGTRTYRISNATIRRKLVAALQAALPLCLDNTSSIWPEAESSYSGGAPSAVLEGKAASGQHILAIHAVLYKNALVMRTSIGIPNEDLPPNSATRVLMDWWVFDRDAIPGAAEALRSGFPEDVWPVEEVEQVPAEEMHGSWLASVSLRNLDRPLFLEYDLMGTGAPPHEWGGSWRTSPPLSRGQAEGYHGRVLKVTGEKRGETIVVEAIEVLPGSLF
ncbi:hypothetical protein J2847_005857 [Azospirillum agricola]|uniref:hypothetical protein n=1 Tax=Azospirillum agricola TaxID=1720247 RepID=UPI001AE42297|nr:hypothetical protein [Azospirillum agricola]MBP2232528.1 hypothetical protein [Azospirillum agricola]